MSLPDQPDDDDQAWNDAFADDSDDDAIDDPPPPEPDPESPPPEPEPDPPPEPEPPPEPAPPEDLEKLQHKLRSAEGRFSKFEEHIDGLKSKISELESKQAPPPEPKPDPIPLPEGWTKEDWEDFEADYPVQAELLANQNRQVQQLTERVDHSEQVITRDKQAKDFDDEIHRAHPDYDELLSNEREQIVSFIEGQQNPTLKAAYQFIYQQGDAPDIINLVSDYKARGRKSAPPDKPPVNPRIDDALAVPGRSPAPVNPGARAGIPDESDFESSWNYFSDESLD